MVMLELSDQQVVGLVRQLPPAQKRAALLTLAEDAARGREERMAYAGPQIPKLCEQRGLDWRAMSHEAREATMPRPWAPCGPAAAVRQTSSLAGARITQQKPRNGCVKTPDPSNVRPPLERLGPATFSSLPVSPSFARFREQPLLLAPGAPPAWRLVRRQAIW